MKCERCDAACESATECDGCYYKSCSDCMVDEFCQKCHEAMREW